MKEFSAIFILTFICALSLISLIVSWIYFETIPNINKLSNLDYRLIIRKIKLILKKSTKLHFLSFIALSSIFIGSLITPMILEKVAVSPLQVWNSSRLASTFAIAKGIQLYQPINSGSLLTTLYGPVTYLSYSPAVLSENPTNAVLIATIMAMIFYLLPVILFIFASYGKNHLKDIFALVLKIYVFSLFCFFTYANRSLSSVAWWVHADAPSLLCLGLSAYFIYMLRRKNFREIYLWLSTLFSVFAVFCKITMIVPILPTALFVFLTEPRKVFLNYLVFGFINSIGVVSLFSLWFDFKLLMFNIVDVPGRHPAWNSFIADLVRIESFNLFWEMFIPSGIILLYCIFKTTHKKSHFSHRDWFTNMQSFLTINRWSLLMMIGFYNLPISILGKIKYGGHYNSFTFSVYFISIAACLVTHDFLININTTTTNRFLVSLMMNCLVLTNLTNNIDLYKSVYSSLPNKLQNIHNNPSEIAFKYMLNHRDIGYFPWHPLSTLMATNTYYHSDEGIVDRELAGYAPKPDHLQSGLPPNMDFIAVGWNEPFQKAKEYLPEFRFESSLPELPGFTLYFRFPQT